MDLYLTEEEQQQLEILCDKELSYAQSLWNITMPGKSRTHFTIDRHDALDWKYDSRGRFPRAQGSLKDKLDSFYQRIN